MWLGEIWCEKDFSRRTDKNAILPVQNPFKRLKVVLSCRVNVNRFCDLTGKCSEDYMLRPLVKLSVHHISWYRGMKKWAIRPYWSLVIDLGRPCLVHWFLLLQGLVHICMVTIIVISPISDNSPHPPGNSTVDVMYNSFSQFWALEKPLKGTVAAVGWPFSCMCVKGAILGLSHANQVRVKSVPDGPTLTTTSRKLEVVTHCYITAALTRYENSLYIPFQPRPQFLLY
jgi:hypothetical protein